MDRKERRSPIKGGRQRRDHQSKESEIKKNMNVGNRLPTKTTPQHQQKFGVPPPKNKSTTKGKDRKKEFERKTNEQREKKTNNTNNKKKQTTKPTKQKTKRKQTRNKKQSHKRIKNVKRHPISLPKFIYSLSVNHLPIFLCLPLFPKNSFSLFRLTKMHN